MLFLGFVFQTFNLLATMSAFENVELPMTILGKLNAKERKKKAKHLLKCMLVFVCDVAVHTNCDDVVVGLQDRLAHLVSCCRG